MNGPIVPFSFPPGTLYLQGTLGVSWPNQFAPLTSSREQARGPQVAAAGPSCTAPGQARRPGRLAGCLQAQTPPPRLRTHPENSWSGSPGSCSSCPSERAALATTMGPDPLPSFSLLSSEASRPQPSLGYSSLYWPELELRCPSPGQLPALTEGSHQACAQAHGHPGARTGSRHLPHTPSRALQRPSRLRTDKVKLVS